MELYKVTKLLNSSTRGSVLLFLLIGITVLAVAVGGAYFFSRPSFKPSQASITNTDFNVLIIGWDGAQWDEFNECYSKRKPTCYTGLPNIKELSGGGKRIFPNVIGNGETETMTGWPQILTGYNSGYTKIINKKIFQPVPKGGTLFEKLEKALGSNKITTAYIGVRDTIVSSCTGETLRGRTNTGEGEGEGEDVKTVTDYAAVAEIDTQGGPWCNMKTAIDLFINDPIGNSGTGEKALEALETYKNQRFIMFTLFADADDAGHKKGFNSVEYDKGLIDNDLWLGKLMEKLKNLGIDKMTYIYVISDHGWDVVKRASAPADKQGADGHDNAPFGILATNDDSIIRPGDRRDLTPTILKKYGAPLSEDKQLNLEAVNGYPLDAPLPFTRVPEGGVYIKYEGAPKCVSGTSVVEFSKFIQQRESCLQPQGGNNIVAGYCVACGDNECRSPENSCNCPIDCK